MKKERFPNLEQKCLIMFNYSQNGSIIESEGTTHGLILRESQRHWAPTEPDSYPAPAQTPNRSGAMMRTPKTPEYLCWLGMRQRCNKPRRKEYRYYGGRGIRVCEAWDRSFSAFLADMGRRPSPSHTLDRINNDGDYEPGNCRWATWSEQNNNTRFNRNITYLGETLTVAQWSKRVGIKRNTLWTRLDGCGWTFERAISTPIDSRKDWRTRRVLPVTVALTEVTGDG